MTRDKLNSVQPRVVTLVRSMLPASVTLQVLISLLSAQGRQWTACERGLDAGASSGPTIDERHFWGHIIYASLVSFSSAGK